VIPFGIEVGTDRYRLSTEVAIMTDHEPVAASPAKLPPRERILAAASDLFYRHGIRAVGVEAIAEAAGTNKMALYRHFASKDELVAAYLRLKSAESDEAWAAYAKHRPGDPMAQLHLWLADVASHVTSPDERGCAVVNAAVEIPERDHPARQVIEAHMVEQRRRLVALCEACGVRDPEILTDGLYLLLEGARVTSQALRGADLGARLVRIGAAMIEGHRG
jgi:AcrR family transcriptional regulator